MKIGSDMTRRSVLTGLAATASVPLINTRSSADTQSGSVCSGLPSPATATANPQRAISLRQMSAALEAGRPAVLEKLTRLDGYVIDADNRDIVLWGLSEPGQPDLHIEDFVVALRAAHGKYGVLRNGVNYISNPLISIDPVASIFPQMATLNLRTSEGQARFRQICATPQPVRIEGMPRNTRVAKTLVDADYRMKQVGQGTVSLPIRSGFPSHYEVRLQKWKEAVDHRQKFDGFHTRFWFQAGRFSHQADDAAGTIFLDRAQVILNDEDQAIAHNSLAASGRVDPITRAWACAWSERMDDVYKAEPIWRDMYNIFRHFSVARIMKDLDTINHANFDAAFLLERYEVPSVPVSTSLPGLGRYEQYLPPGLGPGSSPATNFICGGVAVGFSAPIERNPISDETASSTTAVLGSRPGMEQVSWTIEAGARTAPPSPSPPSAAERPGSFLDMPGRPGFGGSNIKPL
jgi:hypothetical protein